jgi:hypothetical protein
MRVLMDCHFLSSFLQSRKIIKFAEPKKALFPNKFNFKRYETARRISETEAVNARAERRTSDLSRPLAKYSAKSSRARGVNKRSVRGTKRLGSFHVEVFSEITLDEKIYN